MLTPLRSRLPHSLQTAPVGRVTPIPHAESEFCLTVGFGQKILTYFGLWRGRITPIPHEAVGAFIILGAKVSKYFDKITLLWIHITENIAQVCQKDGRGTTEQKTKIITYGCPKFILKSSIGVPCS